MHATDAHKAGQVAGAAGLATRGVAADSVGAVAGVTIGTQGARQSLTKPAVCLTGTTILTGIAGPVSAPRDVDALPGLALEVLFTGSARATASVLSALSEIARSELAGAQNAGVATCGASTVSGTRAAVLAELPLAHAVAAALAAVGSTGIAGLIFIADAVPTGSGVLTLTGGADIGERARAAASSASVTAALLAAASREDTLTGLAGLTAGRAPAVSRTGSAVLSHVQVACPVATPRHVGTGPVLAFIVFIASPAGATTSVVAAFSARTSREGALTSLAGFTATRARTVHGTDRAVLVRVTRLVPAPRHIDAHTRLALVVHLACATGTTTSVFSTFPSDTGCKRTHFCLAGLPAHRAPAVLQAGLAVFPEPGLTRPVSTAAPAVLGTGVTVLVRIAGSVTAPGDVQATA
jgi:hypothetical protein